MKSSIYLRKAYNAFDRERCVDILMGCGVGLWTESILHYHWYHLSMVTRAGCYYRTPFNGRRVVTQADPLYPTIFNTVVDVVICHWVILVTGYEAVPDRFG